MSPCLTDSAIAEFVQGVSTAAEALAVEAHVARCAQCRALLSQSSSALLPPDAPPRSRRRVGRAGIVAVTIGIIGLVGAGAWRRLRPRPAGPAPGSSLALIDGGTGSTGVMLGELLRASLGNAGVRVIAGDTTARAAREFGSSATPGQWQRRLGVTQLVMLATETETASGQVTVALSLWPPASSPLREAGSAADLVTLARRLDARVRTAWQWRAPPPGELPAPTGAALRAYAEGLLAHGRGDEAGALARWTEAARLAPNDALIATALAEALVTLGRPRPAHDLAARALAEAERLPPPWRAQVTTRAQLAARGEPAASDDVAAPELAAATQALRAGDGAAARGAAQAAARAATSSGATTALAASHRLESAAALLLGDVAQARALAADAVARAAALDDGAEEIDALLALGVAQAAGRAGGPAADSAAAEPSFTRALERARALGRLDRVARALEDLAALAARAGRDDEAARWLAALADAADRAGEAAAAAAARRQRAALIR
jgi:hypothetical protein